MSEDAILALLRAAYDGGLRHDADAYRAHMEQAARILAEQPEKGALDGELLLLGTLAHLRQPDELLALYREAAQLVPARSRVLPARAPFFWGLYSPFAILNPAAGHAVDQAGQLEELVALHHRLTGGGLGTDLCYRAQLSYYRGELGAAREGAKAALEAAQGNGQALVAICAADLLANLSIHARDHSLWQFAGSYLRKAADGDAPDDAPSREVAQVCLANLDVALGVLQGVPKWLREGDFGAISDPTGYRMVNGKLHYGALPSALAALIQYHSYRQEPVAALNVADMAQRVFGIRSLVTDAYFDFFRAGCYAQLGEMERMRASLADAVQTIAPDGLWMIAAVFAPPFRESLYAAAAKADPAAPAAIRHIGEEFWDKLRPLREHIMEGAPAELSAREREVATLLMQGRSNAEIAAQLHISVRTVRAHLENIYRKHNVSRRTQLSEALERNAVEIAFWSRNP